MDRLESVRHIRLRMHERLQLLTQLSRETDELLTNLCDSGSDTDLVIGMCERLREDSRRAKECEIQIASLSCDITKLIHGVECGASNG